MSGPMRRLADDVLEHALLVLCTDGSGTMRWSAGRDEHRSGDAFVANLDLALAAVDQLGRQHGAGDLDCALLMYHERLIAVANMVDGRVVVVASSDAAPGIVLRDVRRLVAAGQEPPAPTASAH